MRWREIQEEIRRCSLVECEEEGVRGPPGSRVPPFEPEDVEILFISEAPPLRAESYFYFEEREDKLRRNLFGVLGMAGFEVRDLRDFLSLGFFLLPTVKCPSQRRGRNAPPRRSVIRRCAERFLFREVEFIKPSGICLLGRTAHYGFKLYLERRGLKASLELGRIFEVEIGGKKAKVVPSLWPAPRHRRLGEIALHIKGLWEEVRNEA